MTHLTLICHAATEATRQTRFPLDEPLTEQGAADAAAAASMIGRNQQAWHGPSARCAQTAAALGLAAQAEPELRDWDIGRWAGHRLTDLHDSEPEAVGRWLTDPTAAPHDGESLAELVARVARWLHGLPAQTGRVVAVTHPAVIRAAVVTAIRACTQSFWRVDVTPLSLTVLSGQSDRWTLRSTGRPRG
jgi:broad specificity phosphatase PhoE